MLLKQNDDNDAKVARQIRVNRRFQHIATENEIQNKDK
jgi:hypothetical protein